MCATPYRTADPRLILEAKRAELCRSLRNRELIEAGREPDHTDELVAQAERDTAVVLMGRDSRLLLAVIAALERIGSDEYGVCECGARISEKRLAAVPWASLCLRCAERADLAERTA